MEDVRYPIGKFQNKEKISGEERRELLRRIAEVPVKLRAAVAGLNEQQLETPYRPDGWTVRQVVHHVADSHMNAFVRMKLALTEHEPTIKPYEEALWAETPDTTKAPIDLSLKLIEGLHGRWMMALESLAPQDFQRMFRHPQHGLRSLDWLVQLYAWHGQHHVAHITSLRERNGWK